MLRSYIVWDIFKTPSHVFLNYSIDIKREMRLRELYKTKTENLAHFYTLGKLQSQDFHSIISDMEHQSLHQND